MFKCGLVDYYRQNPDKMDDPEGVEGRRILLQWAEAILKILDHYNITSK